MYTVVLCSIIVLYKVVVLYTIIFLYTAIALYTVVLYTIIVLYTVVLYIVVVLHTIFSVNSCSLHRRFSVHSCSLHSCCPVYSSSVQNICSVHSCPVHSCCSIYSRCSVRSYIYVPYIQSQNRNPERRKFIVGLHFVFCEKSIRRSGFDVATLHAYRRLISSTKIKIFFNIIWCIHIKYIDQNPYTINHTETLKNHTNCPC